MKRFARVQVRINEGEGGGVGGARARTVFRLDEASGVLFEAPAL